MSDDLVSLLTNGFKIVNTGKDFGGQKYVRIRGNWQLNVNGLEEKIRGVAIRVVEAEIQRAYEIALEKVPVRKITDDGHRNTKRKLSSREILSHQTTTFRMMTPSERAALLDGRRVRDVIKSLPAPKEVVTHRNRETLWGYRPEEELPYKRLRGLQGKYSGTQNFRRVRLITENDSYKPAPAGGLGKNERTAARFQNVGGKAAIVPGSGYVAWDFGSSVDPRTSEMMGQRRDARLNKEGRRALREAAFIGTRGVNLRDIGSSKRGGALSPNLERAWSDDPNEKYGLFFDIGGTLRKSITLIEPRDEGKQITARVRAGSDEAYYAIYMERGTRFVAARPFLRPGLASVERTFKKRLHSAISGLRR